MLCLCLNIICQRLFTAVYCSPGPISDSLSCQSGLSVFRCFCHPVGSFSLSSSLQSPLSLFLGWCRGVMLVVKWCHVFNVFFRNSMIIQTSFFSKFNGHTTELKHVAMYAARLHSGARKHCIMWSVLRGIFWNIIWVQCIVYERRCEWRSYHIS